MMLMMITVVQVEFSYTWGELAEIPTIVPKGLQIKTGEAKKKLLFRSSDNSKVIFIESESQKKVSFAAKNYTGCGSEMELFKKTTLLTKSGSSY